MGSCVSSSHNNSSVKLVALLSKAETTINPPINNDVITSSATINCNPPIDSGSGNKDEFVFYDSRPWLDSDCDDDFLSVDGEFTPSRGTTPVHHQFRDQGEEEEEEEASPTDNKKRLVELFKETQDEDQEEDEEDYVAQGKARTCLWLRTPVRSSAPPTPNHTNKQTQLQLKRPQASCVPRLVSCTSFTHRPRNMMTHSPIHVRR